MGTKGGKYNGVNAQCSKYNCDGDIMIRLPADSGTIDIACTTCGEGNKYELFKNGTKLYGGDR